MRAIEIRQPGGPEVLTVAERPDPRPDEAEVLVRVAAAGVNRPDVMQREGRYPPPPGASDIPGLEIAGVIEAAEPTRSGRWLVGDRICALVAGGGYAERCRVPAAQCLPVPRGLSLMEAASLPETYFTVWTNVFERGRLSAGESLLVHGGSSGIGTTAIQLARAFGARVLATAGTDDKCLACERLGAERCINYRTTDFVDAVRAATDDRGVDVVLDMVGGDYVARNLSLLALEGRLIQIGLLGGPKATVNLVPVLQRRLTLTGSTLRPRSVEQKAAIARALEASVWPLIEDGRVRPVIHATFPLAEASEAHRMLEASVHVGKIVLVVDESLARSS